MERRISRKGITNYPEENALRESVGNRRFRREVTGVKKDFTLCFFTGHILQGECTNFILRYLLDNTTNKTEVWITDALWFQLYSRQSQDTLDYNVLR